MVHLEDIPVINRTQTDKRIWAINGILSEGMLNDVRYTISPMV